MGGYLAMLGESGVYTVDVDDGTKRGRNNSSVVASSAVFGTSRIYAVDPESDSLSRIDLATGNFIDPIVEMKKTGLHGPQLAGADKGFIFVQEAEGRRGKKKGKSSRSWVAIDTRTGERKWHAPVPELLIPGEKVAVLNDALIIVNGKGVQRVDRGTGKVLWTTALPLQSKRGTTVSGGRYAHNSTHIFFGIGLTGIVAVRMSNGAIDWQFGEGRTFPKKYRKEESRYGPPAYRDGTLYSRELGNGVIALDASTGKLKWEMKSAWAAEPSDPSISAPVAGSKYVYFPTKKNRWITAVDLKERTDAWVFQGPNDDGDPALIPQAKSGRLVAVSGTTAVALPFE